MKEGQATLIGEEKRGGGGGGGGGGAGNIASLKEAL